MPSNPVSPGGTLLQSVGREFKRYDDPEELLAEGWAAWLVGEEALLALVYGDTRAAAKLKDYYDGVFGPLE